MASIKISDLIFWLLAAFGWSSFVSAAEESYKDVTYGDETYGPVEKLKIEAYLGTWYQTYASASVIYTFQLGGNCVTATYFPTDKEGTIRVLNEVRPFASYADGEEYKKDGWSWGAVAQEWGLLKVNGFAAQSPDVAGALTVELQAGPIPFGIGTPDIDDVSFVPPGNYWIIELGPIKNDLYRWVIVSNSDKTQLYVLVRNVLEFEELYEVEILEKLKNYGFTTFFTRPRKTNQKNCGYFLEDLYDNDDYYHPDDAPEDPSSKDKYDDNDQQHEDDHYVDDDEYFT